MTIEKQRRVVWYSGTEITTKDRDQKSQTGHRVSPLIKGVGNKKEVGEGKTKKPRKASEIIRENWVQKTGEGEKGRRRADPKGPAGRATRP